MAGTLTHDVGAVARQFQIHGQFVSAEPYGSGHINDTYRVVFMQAGVTVRYLFQRINHLIFKDPPALMENIARVTRHLAAQSVGEADPSRRVLTLVASRSGQAWHADEEGNHWRAYLFIEHASTYDSVESPEQAYQAAAAFGQFQKRLADLPSPRLRETIPGFHDTPGRLAAFERALSMDGAGRAALAQREIDFALAHKSFSSVLLDAELPERVTHNDTKLNNVMLDDATGEGLCVIDLDTVMPGLVLYDFGDMVRTTTSPAPEDERDVSKVVMQFPMFEALVRGYLSTAGDFLTAAEKQYLAVSGKLITFEIGVRFLTDFLCGDVYFKVHRDGHNLDRCRAQFALMESIDRQMDEMQRLVERIPSSCR
jgi:Ser/Thr protein kinase RdoA (MazF antagonist)